MHPDFRTPPAKNSSPDRHTTVGWDLGGAHLKAALVDPAGRLRDVVQLPCPLWQGATKLDIALQQVISLWGATHAHAVTMTGELADVFPGRRQGVAALLDTLGRHLPGQPVQVYTVNDAFVELDEATQHADAIASANWRATARFVAERHDVAVLIDVGSTTTDIVPVTRGKAMHRGANDLERLRCDELVYTGVIRTPVCAVTRSAPLDGRWQTLAAELFANMADVYRVLGELPDGADLMDTLDGRGKSVSESAARLARMYGAELGDCDRQVWRAAARHIADCQRRHIRQALNRVLLRERYAQSPVLIGAGVGRFVVSGFGADCAHRYEDFAGLVEAPGRLAETAADCAPAVALAMLARAARLAR